MSTCAPVKKCRDPTKSLSECPKKEDQIDSTNPECTDAHQGSNPNNIPSCDSNLLATDAAGQKISQTGSESEKRMRAYSASQNCLYMGQAATMTGGVNNGYNREAIMIADLRKGSDGRGSTSKTTYSYPGSADEMTSAADTTGYPSESHLYNKTTPAGKDQLRRADITTLEDFNKNKNDARTEVTTAALLKDPECGPLQRNLNCDKKCDTLKRNECLALSAQCAFTDGYQCSKVIRSKTTCFDNKGNNIDCVKEKGKVVRSLLVDTPEECDNDCLGMCHTYKAAQKEGKAAVEGLLSEPYKRSFTVKCYGNSDTSIACRDDGATSGPYANGVRRVEMSPTVTETCKSKDGKVVSKCRTDDGKYADSVHTVLVDDGNPFEKRLYTYNAGSNSFDVERQESGKTTGKCEFLELEQLATAYKCCSKEENTTAIGSYYDSKIGRKTATKSAALLNRKVTLQAF